MKKESEFGKGFVYCLFLFAKHFERKINKRDNKEDYMIFFNGAGDHFFDMEIPKQFKKSEIGKLAEWLKDTGIEYRNNYELTGKQVHEFYQKCEELMILIDEELGVKPIKADWN